MPEVSVILPTCDRPKLVRRALSSLLSQDFPDLEVLLVDSNRRSPPVTENTELADLLRDPRVRILDGRNTLNAAMSRNIGLHAASGEWITFLDDDDEYVPQKISAQYSLARATNAPLVLCGYEFVWPHRRRKRQIGRTIFRNDELLTRAFLGSPALFHRRSETLRFDERLSAGEDYPYALQFIVSHGLREIPCVRQPLVVVHPQPEGESVHKDKEAVWRACKVSWRIIHRHFPRRARRALLAHGRLERAMGGFGNTTHFLSCVWAVLRTRGPHEWRLALYAILTRLRH